MQNFRMATARRIGARVTRPDSNGATLWCAVLITMSVGSLGASPRDSECRAFGGLPLAPSCAAQDPHGAVQPLGPTPPAETGDLFDRKSTHWPSGRYAIAAGDVIELKFPFVPELDQAIKVQPDGYITLREVGDVRVQGRTVPELRAAIRTAYEPILREPVFTIVLKEFENPYFIAAGEVTKPGRYDLRGAVTLSEALAFAGGPRPGAHLSQVVLFRRYTQDSVEVKQVDVKRMWSKRDLSEDPVLRPGDMILVPRSTLSKLAPIIPRVNIGLYVNPLDLGH